MMNTQIEGATGECREHGVYAGEGCLHCAEREAAMEQEQAAPDVAMKFEINSGTAANWYLKRLRDIETEKACVLAQAAAIVKELDADAEGLRFLYESQLQHFVRQELAKKGNRRKSLRFLQGTASFRTVPASVKIADMKAALDHARKTIPDAVKTVTALDTTRYREEAEKALTANGELLPGMESVAEREAFSVKFSTRTE